jgi:RNA polymerase sigma factor (sigma-70 family)
MPETPPAAPVAARSDEELMTAYAEGDVAAFRALFDRNAPLLARVVRAQVGSDDECRDLVQQTFLQLHRARRDYRAGQPLRPWLFTIAYNLCRDRWRARGHRREIPIDQAPPPVEATTASDLLEEQQRAARLRAALADLPPDQRRVVEMHWFAGLPLPEVAVALGASLSAVKVRAHRAYERLRNNLALREERKDHEDV